MTDSLTVAVLGTGIMGAAMARNLLRAGHSVRVWNRARSRAEPLAVAGAVVGASAADAVRDADVILTMVHDGAAVLDVIEQAAPGVRPGAAWVQSTTVGVDSVQLFADKAADLGLVFFDAPVSGTG